MKQYFWRGCVGVAAVSLLAFAFSGCGGNTTTPPASGGGGTSANPTPLAAGIHPLTQVDAASGSGYFEDPLPIHLAATAGSYLPSIAGTTHQILGCVTLADGCYTPGNLTITTGQSLMAQLPPNTTIVGYQNNNVYQDNAGNWQMATTVSVRNASANPNNLPWNVILHASPTSGTAMSPGGIPLTWTSDALLIGSFSSQADANYDGKYIEDGGNLYLIYSKRLPTTNSHDGIVAQSMSSATQVSSSAPVTLLAPDVNADDGLNSELFDCQSSTDKFKLIETGNITLVSGKYAMAYSTGSYESPWSDSLLGTYKKVLQQDTSNVWQNPTPESEVVYLLQAQQAAWPNYVKTTVQGPGVPSLVQYPTGTWYLYFAGYDPSVPLNSGMYDPKLRQPYAMRLNVSIPSGATVAGTANSDLVNWITAATQ
jgi:hypothetical protein